MEGWFLTGSGWGGVVGGRERGAAAGNAGEITTCIAGKRSAASGQQREGKRRCSRDGGDESRSGGRVSHGNLSKGPLFSIECGDSAPTSPARAPVGHSGSGSSFSGSLRQGLAHSGHGCGDEKPAAL